MCNKQDRKEVKNEKRTVGGKVLFIWGGAPDLEPKSTARMS